MRSSIFLSLFFLFRLPVFRSSRNINSFCIHKEARARERRRSMEKDGQSVSKREKEGERERAKKSEAVEGKKEDSRRFNTR